MFDRTLAFLLFSSSFIIQLNVVIEIDIEFDWIIKSIFTGVYGSSSPYVSFQFEPLDFMWVRWLRV